MPVLSAWADAAERAGAPVFVSRDWHPATTTHFKAYGGVWPPHCVMNTPGAEFHPDLKLPASVRIVSKGMGETEDAYSAFQARDETGRPLKNLLDESGIRHVYVGGLATDYCVRSTVLDALEQGFKVTLIPDAIRAVNLNPSDGQFAMQEMRSAGADLA